MRNELSTDEAFHAKMSDAQNVGRRCCGRAHTTTSCSGKKRSRNSGDKIRIELATDTILIMKRKNILQQCVLVLVMLSTMVASGGGTKVETESMRISVVYNNVPHTPGLKTGWGFAAVIETPDHTILFDTGGNGIILLSNMEHLGIDPKAVNAVVLSHIHADHTGGLDAFLDRNSEVTVYVPESFPASFQENVRRHGARVEIVGGPRRLFGGMHSTGEMGTGIKEQALIIETPKGLVIITGCAHPRITNIAAAARQYLAKDIYLLMGGFHMLAMSEAEIRSIIDNLRDLGVKEIAPSHCTGDKATSLFHQVWGDDFIDGGCGAIIEVPPSVVR